MATQKQNLLFVCSRNQWRSPTAERLYAKSPAYAARSRGVSASARSRLSAADVAWADIIFVMESDHRQRLMKMHRDHVGGRPVHVLDIPDVYAFMDPDLIDLLTNRIGAVLDG